MQPVVAYRRVASGHASRSVLKRFDAVDKRFDAVDKRFDAIDTRLDALTAAVGRLQPPQKQTSLE